MQAPEPGDLSRNQTLNRLADQVVLGGRPLIRDAFRDTPREELVELLALAIGRLEQAHGALLSATREMKRVLS